MLKGGSRSPKYSAYMGGKPRELQALCLVRRSGHGAAAREPSCTPARSCSGVGALGAADGAREGGPRAGALVVADGGLGCAAEPRGRWTAGREAPEHWTAPRSVSPQ